MALNGERQVPSHYHEAAKTAYGFIAQGGTALLTGARGTGKTQLACDLALSFDLRLAEADPAYRRTAQGRIVYVTADAMADELHAGWKTNQDFAKRFQLASLLIIDEVQEHANSSWFMRHLTGLVDYRYGSMIPTLLVANIDPNNPGQVLTDSILSRMKETGGIIHCNWASFR